MTRSQSTRATAMLGAFVATALPATAVQAESRLPVPPPGLPPLPSIGGSVPGGKPGCRSATATPGVDPRGVNPRSRNPLGGHHFFVDPEAPAWIQAETYKRRGMQQKAELVWKIARQPRFAWFGRFTRPDMQLKVRRYLERVRCTSPGSVALMTVMRHQGRGCNSTYDGGGAAEDARTRRWYEEFAEAIGNARVVIAFEPDSLGTVDCLARARRKARLDTLRHGVEVLSRLPNATIYLEAGASDWEPARRTARQLRSIGIHKVRGFMLNVTHYDWTAYNVRHGLEISRLTGGKPFVVNTSGNGRGPVHYRQRIGGRGRRINVWCHPLKRGLGIPPTTQTRRARVDAYMWISRPGYSSGSCNGGPLPVGSWWPERALMFARYATTWERPPRGTRNGHRRRYTLAQLGGSKRGRSAVNAEEARLEAGGGVGVPPSGVVDDGRRALGAAAARTAKDGDQSARAHGGGPGDERHDGPVEPGPLPGGGYVGTRFATAPRTVRSVQRMLAAAGFPTPADGVFGPRTEVAVRRFQEAHRLLVDGVVGRQTMAALRENED